MKCIYCDQRIWTWFHVWGFTSYSDKPTDYFHLPCAREEDNWNHVEIMKEIKTALLEGRLETGKK